VITPTLNRAGLLEQTLRSVLAQTYPHVEHIVIDGGSFDSTLDVLRKYAPTYDLKWESGPDNSMYEAINRGMRKATGEIVAYLNSDDLYFPWTIGTVVESFAARPRADFVYGDALNIDDESGTIRVIWQPPFSVDYVRRVGFLVQPTVFWRRRVTLPGDPFDTSLKYVADCDFWMRAGTTHRFAKVDEFLAIERDHRATLREANLPALLSELETVRCRYVTLEGAEHARRLASHRRRMALYRRYYWLRFVIASMTPSRLRGSSWANLLASGRLQFSRGRAAIAQLPRVGRYLLDDIVTPDRYWLEPRS